MPKITMMQQAIRAKLSCPNLRGTYVPPEIGKDSSRLMVIGEAPGSEEEEALAPFVGDCGSLLRYAIRKSFGDDFAPYITNAVKFRPAAVKGNRPPTEQEYNAFRDILIGEIAEQKPLVIVALGNTVCRCLSQNPEFKITAYMSKSVDFRAAGHTARLLPCVHPSYVLHSGGVGTHEGDRFVDRFRQAYDTLVSEEAGGV